MPPDDRFQRSTKVKLPLTVSMAAIAFALAVGACSGDSKDPGSALGSRTSSSETSAGVGASFAARATSVCRSALESKQRWATFPAAGFNPTAPDPTSFPAVAEWLKNQVAPTFDAWRDGLMALGPPPSGENSWRDVLAAVAGIAELNTTQVKAATSGDVQGFVEATNRLQAIQPDLERATTAAGVPTCADVHK